MVESKSRKATTQSVQAEVEGVPESVTPDGKVEFMGQTFKMADSIGMWPLIAFSLAQKRGIDSADMNALASIGEMVLDCLDESEWPRFERHATATKANAEHLMELVQKVIEAVAARPSQPPGESSAGRPKTLVNSKALSSIPGMEDMVSVADMAR